jgi:hypothetical protein
MKGAVIGGKANGSRGSDPPLVVMQKPPHGGFFFAFSTALHAWRKHTFTVDPDYLWYGMLLSDLAPFVSDSLTRPRIHSIG